MITISHTQELPTGGGSRVTVLMAVPQYPYPVVGGLERQAHELAKALAVLGVRVGVLSGKIESTQRGSEVVEGIPVIRIIWPSTKWLRFALAPFLIFHVLLSQRKNYDVVHLHQHSWFGIFTILASRMLKKPVLTKLPNVGAFGIAEMVGRPLGWIMLDILFRSDALVAMSGENVRELERRGYPAGRILATPNGVTLGAVGSTTEKGPGSLRVCRVVSVCRLTPQKGIDILLHAWRLVCDSIGQDAMLEIWGSGALEVELRALCHDLGLDGSVRFRGYLGNVREVLRDADMFVLHSFAEGNSNAILEAMAAGLPIISTRVGGTPMLVGEEGAAFLVDPGDAASLAQRLVSLIQDPSARQDLGSAMRRRVGLHFDILRVAERYAAAYSFLAVGMADRISELSNPIVSKDPGSMRLS